MPQLQKIADCLLRNSRVLPIGLLLFCAPLYADENMPAMDDSATMQNDTEAPPAATSDTALDTRTTTTAPASEAVKPGKKQSPHILRALLTTAIVDREPADEIVSLDKNKDRIYFFTEIAGLKGKVIKHRWEYQGKTMAEVNFNVGSPKWRCYSSKNILPDWTGIWTVSVVDDKGEVLAETYFEVTD